MRIPNMTKSALILATLAATGLPASLASAQFKVEYVSADEPKKEKETKHKSTNIVVTSDDDGHEYKVKIIDGELSYAEMDGKELKGDVVKLDGQAVIFLTSDGTTLHEIQIPQMASAGLLNKKSGIWKSAKTGENNFVFEVDATMEGKDGNIFDVKVDAKPKVMLGINLGEPSAILRKHLKLGDDVGAILVESVIDGLPAQAAGLEDFDVIVSIDGSDEADGEILRKILSKKDAGDSMKLVVLRGGDRMKLKVKLVEYDAEALGSVTYFEPEHEEHSEENSFEFKILNQLENGNFPEIQEVEIAKLKEELHSHLSAKMADKEIAEVHGRAMEAMRGAQRQLLELRDGKLIVQRREINNQLDHVRDQLSVVGERLPQIPEQMHSHMGQMEERLAHLEARLNRQMDEMNVQMDRLTVMFERLMDRLEADRD
ncbi:MAG: PDZ domain-containing protein [Phycisphaerales bacterium]|nr:PDZ domain-containing protein [Phycisphaerales bacterium]